MQNISFYLADCTRAKGYSTIYKRARRLQGVKGSGVSYVGIIYCHIRTQESDRNHLSCYSKQTGGQSNLINWLAGVHYVYRNHIASLLWQESFLLIIRLPQCPFCSRRLLRQLSQPLLCAMINM